MGLFADTFVDLEPLQAHPNPPSDGGAQLYVYQDGHLYVQETPPFIPTGPVGPSMVWSDLNRGPLVFIDPVATIGQVPTAANVGVDGFVTGDTIVRQADWEMFVYGPVGGGNFGMSDIGSKWAGQIANGMPVGGTTGQVLAKKSATNYDAQWVAQPGGGGGGSSVASMNTAARMHRNAGLNTVATTYTKVPFDAVDSDPGNHTSGNSRYVCPANGWYRVTGCFSAVSTAASQRTILNIYKNGALYSQGGENDSVTGSEGMNPLVDDLVFCQAGDFLELYYYCTAAGLGVQTGPSTYFAVVQVDVALQPSTGQVSPGTAARAWCSNATFVTVANTTGFAKIPLNQISYDPGGHVNLTSNRYVAPASGYYHVSAEINIASTAANQWVELVIFKNGSEWCRGTDCIAPAAALGMASAAHDIVQLNAGDYVEIYVLCSTAGLALFTGDGPGCNYMSVAQVDQPIGGAGGNATTPTTAARLYRNTSTATLTPGTAAKVILDAAAYDPGNHLQVANSRYICPVTGYYQVNGQVIAPSASGVEVLAEIYVNGGRASTGGATPAASTDAGSVVSDVIKCNAGDFIELWAFQGAGAAMTPYPGSPVNNFLSVVQVDQPSPVATNTGARAYRTTAFNTTTSAIVRVPIDAVATDPGGHIASGRYNVTSAGWYQVMGNVFANATAGGQILLAALFKNGVQVNYGTEAVTGAVGVGMSSTASDLMFCNPGDFIELGVFCNAAMTLQAGMGGVGNYLSVVKVDQPTYANNPSVVTALPATPFDGQEIYLTVDAANGIKWHLRYNAGSSSAYKWECLGSSALRGTDVVTGEAMTGAASTWQDLATVGPAVTLPVGGDFEVRYGATPFATPGGSSFNWFAGVAVGAAAPIRAALMDGPASAQTVGLSLSDNERLTGVASGTVLKLRYQYIGAVPTWGNRWLEVVPIRVG